MKYAKSSIINVIFTITLITNFCHLQASSYRYLLSSDDENGILGIDENPRHKNYKPMATSLPIPDIPEDPAQKLLDKMDKKEKTEAATDALKAGGKLAKKVVIDGKTDWKSLRADSLKTTGAALKFIGKFVADPYLKMIFSVGSGIIGAIGDGFADQDDTMQQHFDALHERFDVLEKKIDQVSTLVVKQADRIIDETELLFENKVFQEKFDKILAKGMSSISFTKHLRQIHKTMKTKLDGPGGIREIYRQSVLQYAPPIADSVEIISEKYHNFNTFLEKIMNTQTLMIPSINGLFATEIKDLIYIRSKISQQLKEELFLQLGQFFCVYASLLKVQIELFVYFQSTWELVDDIIDTFEGHSDCDYRCMKELRRMHTTRVNNRELVADAIGFIINEFEEEFKFIGNPTSIAHQSVMRGIIYNQQKNGDFYYLMSRSNVDRTKIDRIEQFGNILKQWASENTIVKIRPIMGNGNTIYTVYDFNKESVKVDCIRDDLAQNMTGNDQRLSDKLQITTTPESFKYHMITIKSMMNTFLSVPKVNNDSNVLSANEYIGTSAQFRVIFNFDDDSLSLIPCNHDYHLLSIDPRQQGSTNIIAMDKSSNILDSQITDNNMKFRIEAFSGNFNMEMLSFMDDQLFTLQSRDNEYFVYFDPDKQMLRDGTKGRRVRVTTKVFGFPDNGFKIKKINNHNNDCNILLYKPHYDSYVNVEGYQNQLHNLHFNGDGSAWYINQDQEFNIIFSRDNGYIQLKHIQTNKYITFYEKDNLKKITMETYQQVLDNDKIKFTHWKLKPIDKVEYINYNAFNQAGLSFLLQNADAKRTLQWQYTAFLPQEYNGAMDNPPNRMMFKDVFSYPIPEWNIFTIVKEKETNYLRHLKKVLKMPHSWIGYKDLQWKHLETKHWLNHSNGNNGILRSLQISWSGNKGWFSERGYHSLADPPFIRVRNEQQLSMDEMFIMILQPELYYQTYWKLRSPRSGKLRIGYNYDRLWGRFRYIEE